MGLVRADGQSGVLAEARSPKLQETMVELWARQHRRPTAPTRRSSRQSGRAALEKQGVKFVDVPQAELDATHAAHAEGAGHRLVEEAHISPEDGRTGHGGRRRRLS